MRGSHVKILSIASGAAIVAGGLIAYQQLKPSDSTGESVSSREAPARPAQTSARREVQGMADWQRKIDEVGMDGIRLLMESALAITDPELRLAVVTSLTDKWLLEDISGFTKFWNALEVNGADQSIAILAQALEQSLTKLDPERAGSDEILVVVQRLISYLANTNPDRALEWAKKWLLEDALESALVSVARGMARTDIAKALTVINQMNSPLRRGQALATVGGIWASRDAEAALAWALTLANHQDRALTLNSVLTGMAQLNPTAAAAQLKAQALEMINQYRDARNAELAARGLTEADLANDPESYKEMLAAGTISPSMTGDVELMAEAAKLIGSKLGNSNPGNAANWATSLENEYLVMKSVTGVLEGWVKTDPAAAVAYLSANFPNNGDMLASTYSAWALADPLAAADGIHLIGDAAQRALALEAVVKTWSAKSDPVAVAQYLSQIPASESSDGVKGALVNSLSQTSPRMAWEIAQNISDESAQYRALKAAFAVMVTQNADYAQSMLTAATASLPASTTERLGDMVQAVKGN